MTASEVVHKTVLNPGRTLKPNAKAIHGTHQSNQALGPLQRKSRLWPDELDLSPLIFALVPLLAAASFTVNFTVEVVMCKLFTPVSG